MLVRTVECIEGRVEIELVCEPVFDYGRTAAEWNLVDGGRAMADATGAGQTIRLVSDLALGIEGGRVRGRHVLSAGERAYCALSWAEELAAPQDVDEAEERMAATGVSGATGWGGLGSPITASAIRSNARRSRSRA